MTAGVREALKPWLRRLARRHALTTLGSAAAWSLAAAWPGLVLDRVLVERTGLWLAGAAAIVAASVVLVRGWSRRPGFIQAARAADAHAGLRQQAVTALALDDAAGGAAVSSPELAQLLALQRRRAQAALAGADPRALPVVPGDWRRRLGLLAATAVVTALLAALPHPLADLRAERDALRQAAREAREHLAKLQEDAALDDTNPAQTADRPPQGADPAAAPAADDAPGGAAPGDDAPGQAGAPAGDDGRDAAGAGTSPAGSGTAPRLAAALEQALADLDQRLAELERDPDRRRAAAAAEAARRAADLAAAARLGAPGASGDSSPVALDPEDLAALAEALNAAAAAVAGAGPPAAGPGSTGGASGQGSAGTGAQAGNAGGSQGANPGAGSGGGTDGTGGGSQGDGGSGSGAGAGAGAGGNAGGSGAGGGSGGPAGSGGSGWGVGAAGPATGGTAGVPGAGADASLLPGSDVPGSLSLPLWSREEVFVEPGAGRPAADVRRDFAAQALQDLGRRPLPPELERLIQAYFSDGDTGGR